MEFLILHINFSFTIFFALISASLLLISMISHTVRTLLNKRPSCSCETCTSYLSSSWTKEYNNLCDWYTHLLANSPTGTIHVHVLNNVITSNPKNVERILKTRFHNYPKGKHFSSILGDLLGRGIFNTDGDSWKMQRKMAVFALGRASIRTLAYDVVASEIKSRLVPLLSSFAAVEANQENALSQSNVVELQDIFRRFAFDVTCKVSFGFDPGCLNPSLPVSDFATAFDLASKLSAERAMTPFPLIWKMKRLFNLGSEKQLRDAIRSVHELADTIIRNRRRTHDANKEAHEHDDLLSRFMDKVEGDDVFLRDIVVSFLLAGRDTVSSALVTFFWLLSQNPEVAERIRKESDRIMGPDPEKIAGLSELRGMHYLQAAVHESMRLFPPVQFDSKFCAGDDVLGTTFVARGTRVTYHPYAMGRMVSIWGDDCLEFKPERWLTGEDGAFRQADPYKYPVFQAGLRVCLGKEMALLEMKCVALTLVRMFDFEKVRRSEGIRFVPGLTATIRGGLPVVVHRRKQRQSFDFQ